MDLYQLVILGSATAVSAVVANGAAIGAGIFLLPVLALVFPPKVALGLGAPIQLIANLVAVKIYWGEWDDWRDLLRLLIAAGIGIWLGAMFINVIPSHIFKIGIASYAICFSLYHLIRNFSPLARVRPVLPALKESSRFGGKTACIVIGALGGVTSVLAHAGGIVWSIYYVTKGLDKRRFVGTLVLLFTLTNVIKISAYIQIGILDMEPALIVLALFPIILLSGLLGNFLNKRICPQLFRKVVLVIILAAGIGLAVS